MTKYGTRTLAAARGGASLTALFFAGAIGCSIASAQTLPVSASSSQHGNAPSGGVALVAADKAAPPAVTGVATAPVQLAQADPSVTGSADTGAQEIVVQGLRRSIQASLNDKRSAAVMIDEINAQDIADFPDSNLAESLQRLPGVSIERDNGEGRTITVRGLSGDFNRTRINGMEALSTAGSNDSGTSPNRSRAFDYNTFASELFSSLRVQKTPSAETDEGSLGATIDLITGKPFDFKGNKFGLSTQASYNENSKKANPRIAGLASFRFGADKRMGLLFSGAYNREVNIIHSYMRAAGQSDYVYRGSQFVGEGTPQRAGFAAGRQILLHRAAGPRRISIPAPNPDLRSSADLRKSTKACYKQSRGDPQLFSDGFSYVRGVCSPQAFHEPKGRDRNERQNEKCSAGQESRH